MTSKLPFTACCLAAVFVSVEARAELTAAGQEVSAAIEAYCASLQGMNEVMRGVKDLATADAATVPLRRKTKEMYLSHRHVQEISVNQAPSDEDYAELTRRVLELQILQAEFEQQCLRLSEQQFYGSAKLARLFQAIAELYRREQTADAPSSPSAAPAPGISEEERLRREQRRNERLKLYGAQ